jgi:hypothetical protein
MMHDTLPWRRNIAIGDIITISQCSKREERHLWIDCSPSDRWDHAIIDIIELMRASYLLHMTH